MAYKSNFGEVMSKLEESVSGYATGKPFLLRNLHLGSPADFDAKVLGVVIKLHDPSEDKEQIKREQEKDHQFRPSTTT